MLWCVVCSVCCVLFVVVCPLVFVLLYSISEQSLPPLFSSLLFNITYYTHTHTHTTHTRTHASCNHTSHTTHHKPYIFINVLIHRSKEGGDESKVLRSGGGVHILFRGGLEAYEDTGVGETRGTTALGESASARRVR